MDTLTLSRLQFGSTVIYHYLFVPLSLGLSIAIAIMETCYVRSNNPAYKRMTQFWGNLFFINFALGILTGFVQEFQFAMNWSVYAKFMDDLLGAPSAIEALLAFFLEWTFLGVWLFGWEQLPKQVHLAAIWLVVIITHLSTFWILMVNSFMQEPVGFVVRNGQAEIPNLFALFTNPNLGFQFPHIFFASIATGAFFIVGISAYHLRKKSNERDLYQKSILIGLILALIGSLGAALAGHLEGQHVVQNQPMKMAAAEALWHTENPASFSIFMIGDPNNFKDIFAIKIPYIESFMSYNSFNHPVQGISELQAQYVKEYGPGNYVPPVFVTYWAFRLMLGVAGAMAVLASVGLFLLWKKRLEKNHRLLGLLIAGIFIPSIGNTAGEVLAEIGRQPWLVFGQLKTDAGVSGGVSPTMILFTFITFLVLCGILAIVDAYMLVNTARSGVPPVKEARESERQDELAWLI